MDDYEKSLTNRMSKTSSFLDQTELAPSFTVKADTQVMTATPLDRTMAYHQTMPDPRSDSLEPSEAWLKALTSLDDCDYESAFKVLLDAGDDLFLLRLMYKTGPEVYRYLKENTSLRLFARVVAIAKGQFLNDAVLDFFFEACDSGMAAQLDQETVESMLMVLECIAPATGDSAILRIVADYLKNVKAINYKKL